jgi:hypothetical protein
VCAIRVVRPRPPTSDRSPRSFLPRRRRPATHLPRRRPQVRGQAASSANPTKASEERCVPRVRRPDGRCGISVLFWRDSGGPLSGMRCRRSPQGGKTDEISLLLAGGRGSGGLNGRRERGVRLAAGKSPTAPRLHWAPSVDPVHRKRPRESSARTEPSAPVGPIHADAEVRELHQSSSTSAYSGMSGLDVQLSPGASFVEHQRLS